MGRVHAMTTIIRANNEVIEQQKPTNKQLNKSVRNHKKSGRIASSTEPSGSTKGVLEASQAELNVLVSNLAYEEATKEEEKNSCVQKKKPMKRSKQELKKLPVLLLYKPKRNKRRNSRQNKLQQKQQP